MRVSKKSIYGRHASALHRTRSASYDAISRNTSSSSVHVGHEAPPLPYSSHALPRMPRPFSAMAVSQLPRSLSRPPLSRSTSSSISQQLPLSLSFPSLSPLPLYARSTSPAGLLLGEDSLSAGRSASVRKASNRIASSPSTSASPALDKPPRPLTASSIVRASPGVAKQQRHQHHHHSKQQQQQQQSYHQQQQQDQLQLQLKLQPQSSPPPPQRQPSPPPEADYPAVNPTYSTASTETTRPQRRWSPVRQSQLHYALRISVLVVAVSGLILVKVAFFIGKTITSFYKAFVMLIHIVSVQTVAVRRHAHFLWRDKLMMLLYVAERFEKRALEKPKRSSPLSTPNTQLSPAPLLPVPAPQAVGEDSAAHEDGASCDLKQPQPLTEQKTQITRNRSKTFILPAMRNHSTMSANDDVEPL